MKKQIQQEILMCPPTYYAIEYKINPWMTQQIDRSRALQQWENLKKTFKTLGLKVSFIEPIKHLPDMVFTGDQGTIYNRIFLKSNFRYKERQRESLYTVKWFEEKAFTIVEFPKNCYFEGQGDMLFLDEDTILIGTGYRTSVKAAKIIATLLGKNVVPLKLINPYFYHLDTALCVLPDKTIMMYEKAFDEASLKKIKKLNAKIISVQKKDAYNLACNSLVYKNYIVINKECSKELINVIKKHGLKPIEIDLSEFMKAGGGAHCLTWNSKPI